MTVGDTGNLYLTVYIPEIVTGRSIWDSPSP